MVMNAIFTLSMDAKIGNESENENESGNESENESGEFL
jgi:hypothetical protein